MIVLASVSPRRKELLSQLVTQYTIVPADINEAVMPDELAVDYVVRMAKEKASASLALVSDRQDLADVAVIVIGADTSVVVDRQVLGKPENFLDAKRMLRQLSGRTHQVMTAVCLIDNRFAYESHVNVITDVTFRDISDVEIAQYWQTGEPVDKAGGYGIQGLGSVFVSAISGSYSSVVGLPLYETAQLLEQVGIHPLQEMSHE